jgi:hypothetical protein
MLKRILPLLTGLFVGITFFSCQKELSEQIGSLPGSGGNPPGGTAVACKACSYTPWCHGSVYTYIDTMAGVGTPTTQTINIIRDTTIDGKVFQKFSNPGADGYFNCTAGVSTLIAYSVPATGGAIIKLEQTVLKANAPAGTTWTNSLNNGLGQNVDYNYSIAAKGLTKMVLGVNYTDVIQVHLTISVTVPVLGTVVMGESDYFYANNIGLIDNITYNANPFGPPTMALHRVLQTCHIP